MKKSDLRTGMWVKWRNGKYGMFVEEDILLKGGGNDHIQNYRDDLKNKNIAEHDIVEVWVSKTGRNYISFNATVHSLVWEREEIQYLTQSEAERILSETLGKKVEIKGGENALHRV